MLILKLTDHLRQSHNNFQWPVSGFVECDDWDPDPTCVGGLHGWAKGDGAYRHDSNDGQWLIIQVDEALVVSVEGGDRVKFPKGDVVYCGTREGAVKILTASGSLSSGSDPAWACLTPDQCRDVALRAADRAVRVYAPQMLRAQGREADALTLESLPEIVDRATAQQAKAAARDDARAAAYAADYADYAAYAADLDYHADAAHAAAAAASYAYAAATDACAAACAARKAETESCRMDKLHVLGVTILGGRS